MAEIKFEILQTVGTLSKSAKGWSKEINLISKLEKTGFFKVSDAIKLYDNLLVGRKRSELSHGSDNIGTPIDKPLVDGDGNLDINDEYSDLAGLLNFNPNLILYGPPG